MKKTKTTEITVEMDEFFLIRRSDRSTRGLCETCDAVVQMVTPAEAAGIARVNESAIHSRINSSLLHSTETLEGQVLICLNSLLT